MGRVLDGVFGYLFFVERKRFLENVIYRFMGSGKWFGWERVRLENYEEVGLEKTYVYRLIGVGKKYWLMFIRG